jgi:type II secretory pathway component GspD/PulD (secretin)
MRSLSIILLLINMLVICPTIALAADSPAVESPKISMEVKDTPLMTVIESLFKGSGKNYSIDPALSQPPYDKVMISATLKDVTFDEALKTITKTHGLVYRVSNGVYLITPKPASNNQAGQDSSKPNLPAVPGKPTQLIDMTLMIHL